MGAKDHKKRVGVNVAINIRTDKLPPSFDEDKFVNEVAELLVKYASQHDPQTP